MFVEIKKRPKAGGYKPGKDAELELEFLSNSSPAGEMVMLATNYLQAPHTSQH
jgi:hypothetical protein